MLQQDEKYLYLSSKRIDQRIGSKICELESVINIALSVKRIPVISEHRVSAINNKPLSDKPIGWERYINLPATKLLKVEAGEIRELSETLQYVHQRDFDLSAYSENQIRYVNMSQLCDKENENYSVLCLSESENNGTPWGIIPKSHASLNGMNSTSSSGSSSFLVIFSLSKEVNDLTDMVLDYFGTSRSEMELLVNILYSSFRAKHMSFDECKNNLNYYACIDTRHKEKSNLVSEFINKCMAKRKIAYAIKKTRRWYSAQSHPSKMPFYIMSETANTHRFDSLKSKYNVYNYTDFKELKQAVTQNGSIDYDLLYLVENNIMRYALVKILYGKMNRFVFEGPWDIYGIERSIRQKITKKNIKNYINRFIKS